MRGGPQHCGCNRLPFAGIWISVYVKVSMLTLTFTVPGSATQIERMQPQ